jgi:integrase
MALRKRGKHYHMDVVVDGIRYREALDTTDRREALAKEKDRVAEIKAGKVAAPSGREFARLPFRGAGEVYQKERLGKVAERTTQFEKERLKPLTRHLGEKTLRTFKPEDVAEYQRVRIGEGVSGRTVNMETSLLRRILSKAKLFPVLMDFPKPFPEHEREIGRALAADQKLHLFRVAASRPAWMVAHCAAVLAANTTCRKVELRHLRWRDVDLVGHQVVIRRSKTAAGKREIPLNDDSLAALNRLLERARLDNHGEPGHYVFPTCEHRRIDPTKPQKSWRTAWRHLVAEAVRQATAAGDRDMATALEGFRFHDLRHQAITELAERGTDDRVIQAIAGHMSKRMVDHYSHVRRAAKQNAVAGLSGGLMNPAVQEAKAVAP